MTNAVERADMISMAHHGATLGRALRNLLHGNTFRRAPRPTPVWGGGADPTRTIESPADALRVAEALLGSVRRRQACERFWCTAAVGPLAALLYASSLHGERAGIGWVHRAVDNIYTDPTGPGWYHTNELCRASADPAAAQLSRQVLRVASLSSRQRESIRVMMRAAIAPLRPCDSTARSA
ncbi:hypothetical protein [Mycobacterium sp. 29Ha]|uniref:hypothetical protein n=1 Tax=Mycobacterium sp. 29Ha TaxID=2939268 RepID=UPI0029391E6C|nr:hypothetical protein [Mycobacterium sp. 29Ha]MDV3133332.1 hypothetical protein [Mycobacterium sp. 29Ha]